MRIWKSLSLLLIGLGVLFMLGMGCFVGRLSDHSVWYLGKFYKDQPATAERYDALYQYAKDLTRARNNTR